MSRKRKLNQAEYARSRGIYLLPNLFTLAGLFASFYSIVASTKGMFGYASASIFIAMLADSLDGRVARLSNTQSAFGAEFDSLSDMVGFGLAPALLAYNWALLHLGKLGWLAAFCYVAATGLRLARFNTRPTHNKRYFRGLASTPAAGFIAGVIWVQYLYQLHGLTINIINAFIILGVAVLLVSNIHYRSFKDHDLKKNVSFVAILGFLVLFVGIAIDPPRVLLALFCIYILSGPLAAWHRFIKKRRRVSVKAASPMIFEVFDESEELEVPAAPTSSDESATPEESEELGESQ